MYILRGVCVCLYINMRVIHMHEGQLTYDFAYAYGPIDMIWHVMW